MANIAPIEAQAPPEAQPVAVAEVGDPEAQETQPNEAALMIDLLKRIGFSPGAAQYLVEEQELKTLEALAEISDDDVTKVCKICRKPGGMYLPPPAANGRARAPIPHPGNHVAMTHEVYLGLAAYYLKHKKMTSRTYSFSDVTVSNIKEIQHFKTEMESREDPLPETAPPLSTKNKFEWFDLFRDFLNEHTGSVTKRPLGYVVRKSFQVTPEEQDPRYGHEDSDYADFYDEITARAPIKYEVVTTNGSRSLKHDPHFRIDNTRVWTLLSKTLEGTENATYIEQFKSKKDGREAFLHLHQQLLGRQAISAEANRAENTLATLRLRPNNPKFKLEDLIRRHLKQHIILDKLKKAGHNGIDEQSKIRFFLQSFIDPKYESVLGSLATAPPSSFNDAVIAFRTYEQNRRNTEALQKNSKRINIGETKTGNRTSNYNGPTKESDGYDPNKNYDRFSSGLDPGYYYKGKAWTDLTKNQRNYLRAKREERKRLRKQSGNKSKSHNKLKRKLEKKEAQIAQLTSQIEQVDVSSDSTETDDSSYEEPPPTKRMKEKITKIPRKKESIPRKAKK